VCTTGDTAHIDMLFKFLPHTRINLGASVFFTAAMIVLLGRQGHMGMVEQIPRL